MCDAPRTIYSWQHLLGRLKNYEPVYVCLFVGWVLIFMPMQCLFGVKRLALVYGGVKNRDFI